MTPTALAPVEDPARAAYEALAPFYDAYTSSYDHERWLRNLEALAVDAGLEGRRLLDVACGTGKSFMPMHRRGYEVVACDVSAAMVERARRGSGLTETDVFVADMRSLPKLGCFDLATCLDDSVNYLLSESELERAFAGVARNVRPGGVFIFDTNSLAVYRGIFSRDSVWEDDGVMFCWRGHGESPVTAGTTSQATIEVFCRTGAGDWARTSSRHLQRHHDPSLVKRLLTRTGFELVDLYGQVTGAQLEQPADEDRHLKLVYICRRRRADPAGANGGRWAAC
jgi:SAM-dependent methyltransferase